jgi:hypothetical protein
MPPTALGRERPSECIELADQLEARVIGADLAYALRDVPVPLNESIAAARRVAELVRNVANFARRNTCGRNVMEVQAALASDPLKQLAQPVRQYVAAPQVLWCPLPTQGAVSPSAHHAAQVLEDRPGR